MRRPAFFSLAALSLACTGLLPGCTGTGVFLDHTFQRFGRNPNTPAGNSETFQNIRGERVDVPPLLPEPGNVWPDDTRPDRTMEDLQKQQNEEIRRGGGAPGGVDAAPGQSPQVNRANNADRGLPPPRIPPAPSGKVGAPTVQTPNGPALDVTGQGTGRGYRGLQGGASPGGSGILVPNGNGTSTLIGPDGSVQTVPTKP